MQESLNSRIGYLALLAKLKTIKPKKVKKRISIELIKHKDAETQAIRNIDKILFETGMPRKHLAVKSGLAYNTLNRIMNGANGITLHTLGKIAKALNVDPAILLAHGITFEMPAYNKKERKFYD